MSSVKSGVDVLDRARKIASAPPQNVVLAVLFAASLLLHGCAAPGANSNGMERGVATFGLGMRNLILSPLMILSGLAQGLAFLPYTIGSSLDELNKGLIKAQAVSLDDSYRATYGVSLNDARVDQRTGEVAGENFGFGRYRPDAMLNATRAFQRLLASQGMPEASASQYAIVGDSTQVRTQGRILLAVVHRHTGMQAFRVVSKHTGIVTTFRPADRGWAAPYERDIDGAAIDEVIDWAAIEYSSLRQDRVVATLMVIAAEAVKAEKRSSDYWQIERRWLAGESTQVMSESADKVKRALAAS